MTSSVVTLGRGLVLLLVALAGAGCVTPHRLGPAVQPDAARLEATVRAVAVPRDWQVAYPALEAVAGWLEARLQEAGWTTSQQVYEVEGRRFRNLLALKGDPRAPRVVVGAHYDSCGPLPAADDNASGVAVVLELARLLAAHPPRGAVELALWTLEEPPWFETPKMGSEVHARRLAEQGVVVKAALSVETVGYYRTGPGTQRFPVPGATWLWSDRGEDLYVVSDVLNAGLGDRVQEALRAGSPLGVRAIAMPSFIPGVDWSDHASFWRHGYPAVMLTDTAPNRNPHYHEASDTPDTLDYQRLAQVTAGAFEAVWRLAAAP